MDFCTLGVPTLSEEISPCIVAVGDGMKQAAPSNRGNGNQRILFRLEDPLTARFGSAFFTTLPEAPGVYFFTGEAERLLYIGQSANLRARVGSYRHVTLERHPKRTRRMVAGIRRIEWELCESATHAIERERELLLERRPPFNRAGVWIGPPWWLACEIGSGVLRLRLSREPQEVGPLPPAFRHLFGTLLRSVHRALSPDLPLHAYPHGLTRSAVPLCLTLPFPNPDRARQLIAGFAAGDVEPLFSLLDALPPSPSPTMLEFWKEELERLECYNPRFMPHSAPTAAVRNAHEAWLF